MVQWFSLSLMSFALLSFPVGEAEAMDFTLPKVPTPTLDEAMRKAVWTGANLSCFLTSLRFMGTDLCEHAWTISAPPFPPTALWMPTPCLRFNHNVPQNLIHGADKKYHFTTIGPMEGQLLMSERIRLDESSGGLVASPPIIGRQNPIINGDFGASASQSRHAWSISAPTDVVTGWSALTYLSLGSLCYPLAQFGNQTSPGQYLYVSAFDWPTWKGLSNTYWLYPHLMGMTAASSLLERSGMCALDFPHWFCFGSFGGMYPATGFSNTSHMGQSIVHAAKHSLSLALAPYWTYGPLENHLGAFAISIAHMPNSWAPFGPKMFYAQSSSTTYNQMIWPGRPYGPVGLPEFFCTPDVGAGTAAGEMPQIFSQTTIEPLSARVLPDEPGMDVFLWPRYTCCNLCSGIEYGKPMGGDLAASTGGKMPPILAVGTPIFTPPCPLGPAFWNTGRFPIVGIGFLPQLIPSWL